MTHDRDVTKPRPNPLKPYQCGFHGTGTTCLSGPTSDGLCCQTEAGGCDQQDCGSDCSQCKKCPVSAEKKLSCESRKQFQTCIPKRSHWNWRNVLALNLAILTAGILLVCMSLPNHERLFVPGDLSRSHAQILENTLVSERCSLCHTNAHGLNAGKTQEQLCMNCHNSHMPDAVAGMPHDLNKTQFVSLIDFHNASTSSQLSMPTDQGATKCAQCHIEHHGDDRDLKAITEARCQACHQQQFASFSHGHPEFRSFPYDSTRRIAFDHVAHSEKYYAQKDRPFDCKQCHEIDAQNPSQIRRTASFEQACASCHQQPLQASTSDGWAVLQLPSLNSTDLSVGGELLSNWPPSALYGYDGKISLAMRLLLSSDDRVAEALTEFSQNDLSQVRQGNIKQQTAVRTIASGVRQLLQDTATTGQEAWKQRLTTVITKALNRQPTVDEGQLISQMVAGLPPDLFRQMELVWFGKAAGIAELQDRRVAATLVSAQDSLLADDPNSEESADDLLRGSSTQGLKYSNPANKQATPSPRVNSPQLTAPSPQPIPQASQPLSTATTPAQSPKGPVVQKSLPKNSGGLASSDSLGSDSEETDEELLSSPSSSSSNSKQAGPKSGKASSPGKLTANKLVGSGGWYLDSQLLSLKYMPSGHADPVVAAWIQFAALIDSSRPANPSEARSWHSPTWKPGSEAVGGCTECHLLPTTSASCLTINDWQAESAQKAKTFTKFNHMPHMTQAVTADCKHCHRFNDTAVSRYAELAKTFNEKSSRLVYQQSTQQHFRCEFKAMEKSQCNACHRAGGASEGCTQCHNYHVGTSGFEAMQRGAQPH